MSEIAIENVNRPGKVERVDAAMYEARKRALLTVLPAKAPGDDRRRGFQPACPRSFTQAAPRLGGG